MDEYENKEILKEKSGMTFLIGWAQLGSESYLKSSLVE
jgi:hypothetical protein